MRPVSVCHSIAIAFAFCLFIGVTAKAEKVSGARSEAGNLAVLSRAVPETAGMLILGTGLVGVAGAARRKLKASK